jgi:guanyl-specific ribonuclease Sa
MLQQQHQQHQQQLPQQQGQLAQLGPAAAQPTPQQQQQQQQQQQHHHQQQPSQLSQPQLQVLNNHHQQPQQQHLQPPQLPQQFQQPVQPGPHKPLPAGGRGGNYSRKDKSLGLLCDNFLRQYEVQTPGASEVCLDEAASRLHVERRRIYDIVNVLESVEVVTRRQKNRSV